MVLCFVCSTWHIYCEPRVWYLNACRMVGAKSTPSVKKGDIHPDLSGPASQVLTLFILFTLCIELVLNAVESSCWGFRSHLWSRAPKVQKACHPWVFCPMNSTWPLFLATTDEQYVLKRLADAIIDIYGMAAVISRWASSNWILYIALYISVQACNSYIPALNLFVFYCKCTKFVQFNVYPSYFTMFCVYLMQGLQEPQWRCIEQLPREAVDRGVVWSGLGESGASSQVNYQH